MATPKEREANRREDREILLAGLSYYRDLLVTFPQQAQRIDAQLEKLMDERTTLEARYKDAPERIAEMERKLAQLTAPAPKPNPQINQATALIAKIQALAGQHGMTTEEVLALLGGGYK